MWADLCREESGQVKPQQSVSGDGRGGAGEQSPEGLCSVASQLHLAGDLLEGGLDPLRHSAMIFCKMPGICLP